MPRQSSSRSGLTALRCAAAVPVLLALAIGLSDFARAAVDHMRLVAVAREAAIVKVGEAGIAAHR
jgi:Flp pilus assembly protein TadG